MSPLVLSTDPDSPYPVEVAGVGTLGPNGRGGFTAERLAEAVWEFQDADGKPLTGSKLESAVRDYAKARGLRARQVKSVDEQALREEGGAFPAGPSIEEISRAVAERDRAQVEAHAAAEEAPPLDAADLPPQETAEHPATPTPGKEG